ncbi:hypothetical protein Tco_0660915 [Tanacetum coccineum]
MLADELDEENTCLKKETGIPTQAAEGSSGLRQEHGGLNTSWGDWNASLSETMRGNLGERYEVKKKSYEVSANSIFDLKTPLEQ